MDKTMDNFMDSFWDKFDSLDMEKMKEEAFESAQNNPENLSYWFFKVKASLEKTNSMIHVPETMVIELDKTRFDWLHSDIYTEEATAEFDRFLKEKVQAFSEKHPKMFMKTGVFSNKFEFQKTQVDMQTNIGKKCSSIYYTSMIFGVESTNEVVFREMIQSSPDTPTVYDGMPLNTEFRVFYDFDDKRVLGVANYWHPELMKGRGRLEEEDLATYVSYEKDLVKSYNTHKVHVVEEVGKALVQTDGLKGKWSVDILLSENRFWLIDMARMEKSALVKQMEALGGMSV